MVLAKPRLWIYAKKLDIPAERRVSDLMEDELTRIREMIDGDVVVEGDLRRENGYGHKTFDGSWVLQRAQTSKEPPVRGQRTHTNARTRKGPAKAIAGKKK